MIIISSLWTCTIIRFYTQGCKTRIITDINLFYKNSCPPICKSSQKHPTFSLSPSINTDNSTSYKIKKYSAYAMALHWLLNIYFFTSFSCEHWKKKETKRQTPKLQWLRPSQVHLDRYQRRERVFFANDELSVSVGDVTLHAPVIDHVGQDALCLV